MPRCCCCAWWRSSLDERQQWRPVASGRTAGKLKRCLASAFAGGQAALAPRLLFICLPYYPSFRRATRRYGQTLRRGRIKLSLRARRRRVDAASLYRGRRRKADLAPGQGERKETGTSVLLVRGVFLYLFCCSHLRGAVCVADDLPSALLPLFLCYLLFGLRFSSCLLTSCTRYRT